MRKIQINYGRHEQRTRKRCIYVACFIENKERKKERKKERSCSVSSHFAPLTQRNFTFGFIAIFILYLVRP